MTAPPASDSPPHRAKRLAAILHADVVGYSKRLATDEDATLADLEISLALARKTIAAHRGRIAGTAGDAFLAEFQSVTDAIDAGLAFQDAVGATQGLDWRVGVNLGDVVDQDGTVLGDGVNVAARVQSLAAPGAVAVTAAVRAQLGQRRDLAITDMGNRRLKNIPDAVRVFTIDHAGAPKRPPRRRWTLPILVALTLAGLAAVWLGATTTMTPPRDNAASPPAPIPDPEPLIALLPINDLTAAPGQDWFAQGMTENLIRGLRRNPGLEILSMNALSDTPSERAPGAMLQTYGAEYVIDGALRKTEGGLSLDIHMVDAKTNGIIWSDQYDLDAQTLFPVQNQIVAAVTEALGLAAPNPAEADAPPTTDLDAYDIYLRGRAELRKSTSESLRLARWLFEQALAQDPDFDDAEIALGRTYLDEAWQSTTGQPDPPALDAALQHANAAYVRDPQNAQALILRAEVYTARGRLEKALADAEKAISAAPRDPRAMRVLGGALARAGQIDAAVTLLELSLKLDPNPPGRTLADLGAVYFLTGRHEDAVALLTRPRSVYVQTPEAHAMLAANTARLGQADLASHSVEETLFLNPFFDAAAFAGQFTGDGDADALFKGMTQAGLP